jgi:hypothetical protein
MTPASSIAFSEDGKQAWLLLDSEPFRGIGGAIEATDYYVEDVKTWDRSCDTCNGFGWGEDSGGMGGRESCSGDCDGTGRHAFTIEVGCNGIHDGGWCSGPLRVSVREGMVLPIVDEAAVIHGRVNMPAQCITVRHDAAHLHGGVNVPSRITLPPDARPGLWCVLLDVHQNGENPQ